MMLGNELQDYYTLVTQLQHYHKWDLDYINNLIPWQFEIYVKNLLAYLKEEEEMRKQEEQRRKNS